MHALTRLSLIVLLFRFKIEVGDFFKLAPSGSRIRNLLSGSAFIPSTSISTITTSQLQRTLDSKWDEFSGYQLTILDYFHLGLTYNCSLGYDTVGVGEEPKKLENFVVAAVEGSDLPVEYLGLNSSPLIVPGKEPLDPKEVPSFLAALKERLHIPSLSFGYQAGAAHRESQIS